jgi:hypothetical protein
LGEQQRYPDDTRLISSGRADYFDAAGCQRQGASVDSFSDSCKVVLFCGCEPAADNNHLGIEEVDGDGDGFPE